MQTDYQLIADGRPSLPVRAAKHTYGGSGLLVKAVVAAALFAGIVRMASVLGMFFSFLFLDILLSAYLYSLFRGRLRALFLIHPLFVYISGFGFQIPYTEIGVGYTYIDTFDRFVDANSLMVDWQELIFAIFSVEERYYGFGKVYAGVLPVLWFPQFLFEDVPDIAVYYSLSLWTLLCTAIAVNVAMIHRVIRVEVLLIIALYATVSPTFFDINSTLHRYTMLFLGLFLFLIAYIGLTRQRVGMRTPPLIGVLLVAIVLVGISRASWFLSLALFVVLDLWARDKLPIVSSVLRRLPKSLCLIILVALIVLVQIISIYIVPEHYIVMNLQSSHQYQALFDMPLISIVLRLTYAILSPFPWINFKQWELYGDNTMFLGVHMLSALFASWIILSLFARGRQTLQEADDIRTPVMFGVAIMSSLAFGGIGFHVYLAPALPFLATLLHDRANHISYLYSVGFVFSMEMIAQMAQLLR